jgi:hypothetical protein
MSNHRSKCYYCKQLVLSRDIGHHILRRHEKDLFGDKDNVKTLYKDKYFKEPILLSVGTDAFLFCFADSSCIRRQDVATNHFKGKADKHRERLLELREKYPLDGSAPKDVEVRREYLSEDETKLLQDIFAQVVVADTVAFSRKDKALLSKLGIFIEKEKIKEMYPCFFPEPEEEENQEEQEDQEEEEHPPEEEQYEEPPPPLEVQEEEEEKTIEVLDKKKIDIPPPPLPHYTPTLPKPRPDVYLPQPTRQQQYPSIKIIQTTKRPASSGAL